MLAQPAGLGSRAAAFAFDDLPIAGYLALLVLVGPAGARLGLGRSLARTGVKFVPWELAHAPVRGIALAGGELTLAHLVLLALTWLLVGANAVGIGVGRRAVYDVLVGTRVVRAEVGAASARRVCTRP